MARNVRPNLSELTEIPGSGAHCRSSITPWLVVSARTTIPNSSEEGFPDLVMVKQPHDDCSPDHKSANDKHTLEQLEWGDNLERPHQVDLSRQ